MLRAEISRIMSNYIRLIITFTAGIIILRTSLSLGTELFAAYIVLTVGFGLQPMIEQILRMTLQPSFGFASEVSTDETKRVFSNAVILIALLFLLGTVLLILSGLYIKNFVTTSDVGFYVWCLVLSRIASLCAFLVFLPYSIILLVNGKQALNNAFVASARVGDAIAFTLPFYAFAAREQDLLLGFSILAPMLHCVIYFGAAFYGRRLDKRFKFNWALVSKTSVISTILEARHGMLVVLSMNSYSRLALIFTSGFLGAASAQAFGIAIQLSGYLKQIMDGFVKGLDAVFNALDRSRSAAKKTQQKRTLLRASTKTQASISFAFLVTILLSGQPLIQMFLGSKSNVAETAVPLITILVGILSVGAVARNLTQGWRNLMIGTGNTKALSLSVFPGALLFLLCLIGIFSGVIPTTATITLVAWIYSAILVFVHFPLMLSMVTKKLEFSVADLLRPMLIPAVLSGVLCLFLIWFIRVFDINGSLMVLNNFGWTIVLVGVLVVEALYRLRKKF